MKYISALFALCLICLSACTTVPQITPSAAAPGNYTLDPQHVSVIWRIRHSGLSNYTARFDKATGTLNFDPAAPATSSVDIRIDPKSVNTGLPDFNETIATGGNYLDGDTYPEIRFTSTNINITGEARGTITGDLTLKGVTHPVELDVVFNGVGKTFGNPGDTLGFSATGKFLRSNFGINHLLNFGIGDEITLLIEAEFNEAR